MSGEALTDGRWCGWNEKDDGRGDRKARLGCLNFSLQGGLVCWLGVNTKAFEKGHIRSRSDVLKTTLVPSHLHPSSLYHPSAPAFYGK